VVELTLSMPSTPLTAFSIGSVTWSWMSSGLAPGRVAPTNAAGNSIDGNSCCFERWDGEHPEAGDHDRDQGHEAAVGKTEPGQE
jgi:hypothetical protein